MPDDGFPYEIGKSVRIATSVNDEPEDAVVADILNLSSDRFFVLLDLGPEADRLDGGRTDQLWIVMDQRGQTIVGDFVDAAAAERLAAGVLAGVRQPGSMTAREQQLAAQVLISEFWGCIADAERGV